MNFHRDDVIITVPESNMLVIVNISKITWSILMRFVAYERRVSWPHFSSKITLIAKYYSYVIHRLKTLSEKMQGPCAHLGFNCWDMGIVAWVMTNVVLDD
jgi:hypothetical protein